MRAENAINSKDVLINLEAFAKKIGYRKTRKVYYAEVIISR